MNLSDFVGWSLALVPVIVLTAAFIWLDVFKLVGLWQALGLMLAGGLAAIAAYPLSGVFLDTLPIGFSNYSRLVAPWIEEALKSIVIISLFRFNFIGLKVDAVIMGLAVGAGFSVVENIVYLLRFPDLLPTVWLVRGAGTAIMHGTTMAILAAIAHELAERETRGAARNYRFNFLWFVPGLLAAVAVHTVFNQFGGQPMVALLGTLMLAPLSLMAIFRFGSVEARQWLAVEEAAHQRLLDTLYSGQFPEGPGWQRIASLAQASEAHTQAEIREYVTLLTELILASEENLLQQSSDTHRIEVDSVSQFDRLAELRGQLGRTAVSALTSLLPFSRNDYWELWELHHHLRKRSRNSQAAPLV